MEETVSNLTREDVLELVKDFPIVPLRDRVIITTNVEEIPEDEVDLVGSEFSAEQYVLAVGSYSKDFLEPGDKVQLDLEAMSVQVPNSRNVEEPLRKITLKPVEVNGRYYGVISSSKIEYLIKE